MLSRQVPEYLRDWLFDSSSLTARLVRWCGGTGPDAFHVRLLKQGADIPAPDEREPLHIGTGRKALIRQVKLYCGETPLVYARTVIPMTTLTGRQRVYGNLGTRPLGAMLFADKSMRRESVKVTCLAPGHPFHELAGAGDEPLWGRRSVFYVGGKPLLVSEFFLPSLAG